MITEEDRHALRVVQRLGIVRPAQLEANGIPRSRLYRLLRKRLIKRQSRGVYTAITHRMTAKHTLATVARQVPGGTFCLLTALHFHELTSQAPAVVWIALPEKARTPQLAQPPLRVARFSGLALSKGIEIHRVEGVDLRVYSAAKSVADCFKYRHKVGIEVAVEALRAFTHRHRGDASALARYARICRMSRVMQPYLDAMARGAHVLRARARL